MRPRGRPPCSRWPEDVPRPRYDRGNIIEAVICKACRTDGRCRSSEKKERGVRSRENRKCLSSVRSQARLAALHRGSPLYPSCRLIIRRMHIGLQFLPSLPLVGLVVSLGMNELGSWPLLYLCTVQPLFYALYAKSFPPLCQCLPVCSGEKRTMLSKV